jgi:hypothetical protein
MRIEIGTLRKIIREELHRLNEETLTEGRHNLQRVDWEEYIPSENDPRIQDEIRALRKRNPTGRISSEEVMRIRLRMAPQHIQNLASHKASYSQRAMRNWEQSGQIADVYPLVLNNPGFRYEQEKYFYPKRDEFGNETRGVGFRSKAHKVNPDFVMALTPNGDWDWHLSGDVGPEKEVTATQHVELDDSGNVPRTVGMHVPNSAQDRRMLNKAISADQQGRNPVRRRGGVTTQVQNVTPHYDRLGKVSGYTVKLPSGELKHYSKDEFDAVERRRQS